MIVLGALVGFVGSRALRRPDRVAGASSVVRSVGGSLGARRSLTAPELQRACFSEMVRHVRVTRHGRTHAPVHYTLCLHPDDLAVVDEGRRWFTEGLKDALRQAARGNDWQLDGTVSIDYQLDASRRPGVPSAAATLPDELREAGPAAPEQRKARGPESTGSASLALARSDTGEQIRLDRPLTIGRSHDQVITIDDTRVSRAHARVELRAGTWTLYDENSANGTRVGGEVLPSGRPCPLRPGDVIGIGPVELRVIARPPVAGPSGTRALDDHERTRISAEVLPPDRPDQR